MPRFICELTDMNGPKVACVLVQAPSHEEAAQIARRMAGDDAAPDGVFTREIPDTGNHGWQLH
jgi:hypothetical protein